METEMVEFIKTIVMLILGALGMPLVQYFKQKLHIQDLYALLLTGVVAMVLAVGELFLAGNLTLEMFTLENFASVFGLVFSVATIWYRVLKEGQVKA